MSLLVKVFSLLSTLLTCLLATTPSFAEHDRAPVLVCGEYRVFQNIPVPQTMTSSILKDTLSASSYQVENSQGFSAKLWVNVINDEDMSVVMMLAERVGGENKRFVLNIGRDRKDKSVDNEFAFATINGLVTECK